MESGTIRAAVLTVSDGVTQGTREDASGDAAEALLRAGGFDVSERRVVADEQAEIESALRELVSSNGLVVTTGGTGFGPRDVTPEATRAVIEREAPGLAELMRATGLSQTPMAALSRGVAGAVGSALVVNLPGSPKGVRESLTAVLPGGSARRGASVVPREPIRACPSRRPVGWARRRRSGRRARGSTSRPWHDRLASLCGGNAMAIVPGGEVRGTLGCGVRHRRRQRGRRGAGRRSSRDAHVPSSPGGRRGVSRAAPSPTQARRRFCHGRGPVTPARDGASGTTGDRARASSRTDRSRRRAVRSIARRVDARGRRRGGVHRYDAPGIADMPTRCCVLRSSPSA